MPSTDSEPGLEVAAAQSREVSPGKWGGGGPEWGGLFFGQGRLCASGTIRSPAGPSGYREGAPSPTLSPLQTQWGPRGWRGPPLALYPLAGSEARSVPFPRCTRPGEQRPIPELCQVPSLHRGLQDPKSKGP